VEIYLVRHGLAEPGDPYDQSRLLTERGQAQAAGAARWIKQQLSGAAQVWASPYVRTQQTAQPIAAALCCEVETHGCLEPDQTPQKVVDDLVDQSGSIILVTHLPLVGRLASLLIDGQVMDQPWSPAEVWKLKGEVFASGCLDSSAVWYPVLEGI